MMNPPLNIALLVSLALGCSTPKEPAETQEPVSFNANTSTDNATDTGTDTSDDDHADTGEATGGDTGGDTATDDPSPPIIDGDWEGSLTVNFETDPLGTGEMIEATCTGPMVVHIVRDDTPSILGSGECSFEVDSPLALLLGTEGPFPGRTSGSISEDDSAEGVIVLELPEFESDMTVDWTGQFNDIDGVVHFLGEYGDTLTDLTAVVGSTVLVFDVTYSGTFDMVRVPTD
jgi:hypothetical protein